VKTQMAVIYGRGRLEEPEQTADVLEDDVSRSLKLMRRAGKIAPQVGNDLAEGYLRLMVARFPDAAKAWEGRKDAWAEWEEILGHAGRAFADELTAAGVPPLDEADIDGSEDTERVMKMSDQDFQKYTARAFANQQRARAKEKATS